MKKLPFSHFSRLPQATALLCAMMGLTLAGPIASAADGTWTSTSSGVWSNAANWAGGTIANGSGFTGIFNTLDLTSDVTVDLDSARTIANLTFGDTAVATPASWILANNGSAANILALAGGTPTITAGTLGTGKATTISLVLAGSAGLVKAGAGVLVLTGANTFSGTKTLNAGTLRVASIGTTSSTSSGLGSAGGISFTGGTLEYAGAGETSNRSITLAGNGRLDNNGFGALTLTGNIGNTAVASAGLTTGGSGNITYTGVISDKDATVKSNVSAFGGGTVTLTGANTFTNGITAGRGATLILDYLNATANSTNAVLNPANPATLSTTSGGNLYLKGKDSGTTAQTLGTLSFGAFSSIVVDSNGGSGTTLTVGNLSRTGPGALVMDLSSANSTLIANTNGSTGTLVDNVIVGGTTSTSLAGFFVKTSAGYDYASAASAATGQTITALGDSAKTTLASGFTSGNTVNYKITTGGTTNITTGGSIGTLRVDTTGANGGALSIASGQTLTSAKSSILFDGTGIFSISGSGTYTGIAFHQFSSGAVTLSSAFGSPRLDKFGTGLLINNTAIATISGGLNVFGGVYRAGTTQALATSAATITLGNGGILELTSGSGDLTRALGSAANQVQLLSDGGFSAFGTDRVVAFGGTVSPTALTWGANTGFVTSGNKLLLSSATSDKTLDFRNAIDFNGLQREVSVGDGSAIGADARMSGVLSGSVTGSGLLKTGAGTLEVSNTNNYTGPTTVNGGTLLVSGSISGSTTVDVNGGGTLLLGGVSTDRIRDTAAVTLGAGATPGAGGILQTGGLNEGPAGGASGSTAAMGTLILSVNSTLDFTTGNTATGSNLLFAGLNYTPGNTVRILNWTGAFATDDGADGNDRLLFTTDPGFTEGQLSAIQFFSDSGSTPLGFGAHQISFNGYVEIVPIPEPSSTALLGSLGLLGLIGWRERRRLRCA